MSAPPLGDVIWFEQNGQDHHEDVGYASPTGTGLSKVFLDMSLPGFEDLKKYCRQSTDFCKDVASILHDRVKMESAYGDGLLKIANRARKAAGESLGTLKNAWESFANQSEQESEIHKNLASDLLEQLVKPLKTFAETQKEARKPAEQAVEKAGKNLSDKKSEEVKSKKNAFSRSKESESLTVQLENIRGKTVTDKELSKLDQKCKKAEESVQRTDKEHISKLIEAERARLKLEATLASSCKVLQKLEEERVAYMKNMLNVYTEILSDCTPRKTQCYEKVREDVSYINVDSDIETLRRTRGSERQPGEQILFACFEADLNSNMDPHRRKLALESKYELLSKYLKSERRARAGLSKLSSVYEATPTFSDLDTQQDVSTQIRHANAVIDCLDGSVFKVADSMARLGQYEIPGHRLSTYIEETRDKQGIPTLILKVPLNQVRTGIPENEDDEEWYGYPGEYDLDDDDDEFDDVEDGPDVVSEYAPPDYSMLNVCKAAYEYIGAQDDELTIQPGDIITIVQKQGEWWQGELNGKVGLFPANYVEELS